MSTTDRFPGRHPLCNCPEPTFQPGQPAPDYDACRAQSGGITHKLLDPRDPATRAALLAEVLRPPGQEATASG